MRRNFRERIITAAVGLILLAIAAAAAAQLFWQVPVAEWISGLRAWQWGTAILIAALAVLVLLAVWCFCRPFIRRNRTKGAVSQQTEGGQLEITVPALETLVSQCLEGHDEMQVQKMRVVSERDSVSVDLKINLDSGMNIPLAVTALQKQIRQYLTSCSGLEVREVRVLVERMGERNNTSPYAVPAMLQGVPGTAAIEAPVQAAISEPEPEEDRTAHQRIFAHEDELLNQPQPAAAEEDLPAEESSAPAAQPPAADDESAGSEADHGGPEDADAAEEPAEEAEKEAAAEALSEEADGQPEPPANESAAEDPETAEPMEPADMTGEWPEEETEESRPAEAQE